MPGVPPSLLTQECSVFDLPYSFVYLYFSDTFLCFRFKQRIPHYGLISLKTRMPAGKTGTLPIPKK